MIHPNAELRFINPKIGYGVVATRLIPKGTITWVRDQFDQIFTLGEVERMPQLYREIMDKYSFVGPAGELVLCWDLARYVNHSCRPTCLSAGYDFEVAVRDIHPGEELTDDYGTLNLDTDFYCSCGFEDCRKVIRPRDPLNFADTWDSTVAEAFMRIKAVDQPLWTLVKEKREVERALVGETPIASCRLNYYRGERRLEAA
jgi:hypothetical protein